MLLLVKCTHNLIIFFFLIFYTNKGLHVITIIDDNLSIRLLKVHYVIQFVELGGASLRCMHRHGLVAITTY